MVRCTACAFSNAAGNSASVTSAPAARRRASVATNDCWAAGSACDHTGERTAASRGGRSSGDSGQAFGTRCFRSFPQCGEGQRHILDRAREQPRLIERRAEWLNAGRGERSLARLEADTAAERRRANHRTIGLGAECERQHAGRDRGRRAHRRAAGRVRRVPGVARRPGREIGELRGDRLAEGEGTLRLGAHAPSPPIFPAQSHRTPASPCRSVCRRWQKYPSRRSAHRAGGQALFPRRVARPPRARQLSACPRSSQAKA